ncbi:SET domain protein [Aspergillus terreus]|uniref:SET domain protein n=1 Tax=Aspergillus terreus TaxID=33178 RepID=A0A5M3ZCC9_ASPTE|nr:hypothetical protein ATETN484_0014021300 [Aspergillus terreus]GFF20879.1 SET domain protein [Aspergillus terreus]
MRRIMRRLKLGYRGSREMTTIPDLTAAEEPEDKPEGSGSSSKVLSSAPPPSSEPESARASELPQETVSAPCLDLIRYIPLAALAKPLVEHVEPAAERSRTPVGPPPRPPRSPPAAPTLARRKKSKKSKNPKGETETAASDDELQEYTSEHAFSAQYINRGVGTGLVATEFIPAGSVLFAERVVYLTSAEQDACASITEADDLIARKVRAMGEDWWGEFLTLSNPGRVTLDIYAGIWEAHQVPLAGPKAGAMLGLNMAWMNHACVPNCALTVVCRTGGSRRAVVRACADIDPGIELTIAYFYAAGGHTQREIFAWTTFGFVCGCAACVHPAARIERALRRYARAKDRFDSDPELAVARPAQTFQLVQDVVTALMGVGIRDARVAMLWTQCALLAAFHTDVARAITFLGKARKMLAVLEGPAGSFYAQVTRWYTDVVLMPGYAASARGLSNLTEAVVLPSEPGCAEILYMNGAAPHEYVRVGDYRRLPGCVAVPRGGGRYKLLAPGGIAVAPDPSILPEDMAESLAASEPGEGENKPKAKKKKGKGAARPQTDRQCANEKDFLDLCRDLRREHMKSVMGEERTATRVISRSLQDDINDLHRCLDEIETQASYIQTVAARKNVVVTKCVNKCAVCDGEVDS